MMKRRFICLAMICCCGLGRLVAQPANSFNPLETFVPIPYPAENACRTATGLPGTGYWQNRSDYQVHVTLDTATRIISGTETIDFINNSPDNLAYLWVLLDQNRFRKNSVISLTTPEAGSRFGVQEFTEGFVLKSVRVKINGGKVQDASYDVNDMAMKLLLPQVIQHKQKLTIYITYSFTLPVNGSDFMGVLSTKNGSVFQCSVWYPRLAVYDDVAGWTVNADSYYADPGTVDYTVTLPANMIVAGSGQLINPAGVLSTRHWARLQKAMQSDTTVMIRPLAELGTDDNHAGNLLSWHFTCPNTTVAFWAASTAFIWDAVRINLPDHKSSVGMTFYLEECNNNQWTNSTAVMKRVVETYSSKWMPYQFPAAVSVAGSVAGLAGSGITFIDYHSVSFANGVWAKENHEFGHNWFPGMVMADEGKFQWMVEGFDSFINDINGKTLNNPTAFSMESALDWLERGTIGMPVTTPSVLIPTNIWSMLSYVKPAVAMYLLRNEVIGQKRFDEAFRSFMIAWKFRHPTGQDFFRAMDNACGEDLSWFWRSWFLNDWRLDQAIQKVVYTEGDPVKGIDITISNNAQMVMPVAVQVIQLNGKVDTLHLPVQIWRQSGQWTFHYPSVSKVMRVVLDPGNQLPDMNRGNNYWSGTGDSKPLSYSTTVEQVIDNYWKAIGGRQQARNMQPVYMEATDNACDHHFLIKQLYRSPSQITWELSLPPMSVEKYIVADSVVHFRMVKSWMQLARLQQQQLRYQAALFPELEFFNPGFHVVLKDSVININGTDACQLLVTTPWGDEWMYYYDTETGLKLRQTLVKGGNMFFFFTTADFGDYRKSGELLLPYLWVTGKEGKTEIKQVQKLLFNPKELPADFETPGK